MILVLLLMATTLYGMRFVDLGGGSPVLAIPADAYDPRIGDIRSLEGLERAAHDYMPDTGNRSRDLALALTTVVELHSVYGVSRQTWRENRIANMLDHIGVPHMSFAGKMRPEDLVKDNIALCSQASLILQELFRRNGIRQATVRFNAGGVPPHSAVAANPDGVWRYYDPSWEPTQQGLPFEKVVAPGTVLDLYGADRWKARRVGEAFDTLARQGKMRIVNIDGAGPARGIALQRLTSLISVYGWILPLFLACLLTYESSFVRAPVAMAARHRLAVSAI